MNVKRSFDMRGVKWQKWTAVNNCTFLTRRTGHVYNSERGKGPNQVSLIHCNHTLSMIWPIITVRLSLFTEIKWNTNDYLVVDRQILLRAGFSVTGDPFNKTAFIFPPCSHDTIFNLRDVIKAFCYVVSRLTSFVSTYYLESQYSADRWTIRKQ